MLAIHTPPTVDISSLVSSPMAQKLVALVKKGKAPSGITVQTAKNDPILVVARTGRAGEQVVVLFFQAKDGTCYPFGEQDGPKIRLYGKLTPDMEGFRAVNLTSQAELADFVEVWIKEMLAEEVSI